MTRSRPSHALALESLPPKVLLDLVPRHVQLDLDDPRPGTRVDEILLLRTLGPVTVAAKVHLKIPAGTCSFAVRREGNDLSWLNAAKWVIRTGTAKEKERPLLAARENKKDMLRKTFNRDRAREQCYHIFARRRSIYNAR